MGIHTLERFFPQEVSVSPKTLRDVLFIPIVLIKMLTQYKMQSQYVIHCFHGGTENQNIKLTIDCGDFQCFRDDTLMTTPDQFSLILVY